MRASTISACSSISSHPAGRASTRGLRAWRVSSAGWSKACRRTAAPSSTGWKTAVRTQPALSVSLSLGHRENDRRGGGPACDAEQDRRVAQQDLFRFLAEVAPVHEEEIAEHPEEDEGDRD